MPDLKQTNAICFLYNSKYTKQGNIALNSAKLHNPNYDIVHLTDSPETSIADVAVHPEKLGLHCDNDIWMVVGRIGIVEYCLKELGYHSCIFVDGDTYTYNNYTDFQTELDNGYSLVVIPHLLKPLPEDEKYPQNRTICLAGNYNSGFFGATQKSLPFLEWWKYQTSLYPAPMPEAGLASEQGWLRFAVDFDDNVKVFKHPGYNVAYWNIKQRKLEIIDDEWTIDNHKLCLVHFSGFRQELDPSQMSIFQNRYLLDKQDPVYSIFNSYKKLVWQ